VLAQALPLPDNSQAHAPKRFSPVASVAVFDAGPAAGVELAWLFSGAVLRFTLPGSAAR
jgi:hypothetical protein